MKLSELKTEYAMTIFAAVVYLLFLFTPVACEVKWVYQNYSFLLFGCNQTVFGFQIYANNAFLALLFVLVMVGLVFVVFKLLVNKNKLKYIWASFIICFIVSFIPIWNTFYIEWTLLNGYYYEGIMGNVVGENAFSPHVTFYGWVVIISSLAMMVLLYKKVNDYYLDCI